MPLIDVTLGLRNGMIAFPGDPMFELRPFLARAKGDPFDLASLSLCTHTGTHVDPAAHYIDGAYTVDQTPLEHLIGPGIILDMRGKQFIDAQDIEGSGIGEHVRVFFKTDNSEKLRFRDFTEDYCHLTLDAAQLLVEKGIRLVGTDYLSIEKYMTPGAPVHMTILRSGAMIVEALDLLDAPAGPCKIYCLPLKIMNADGAPARVVIEI